MNKTTLITDLNLFYTNLRKKTTFITDLKLFYTNLCIKQL